MKFEKNKKLLPIIIGIILFIIIVIILLIYFFGNKIKKELFGNGGNGGGKLIFKAPISLTKLNTVVESPVSKKLDLKNILSKIEPNLSVYHGNTLEFPGFFHVAEKWPGSLPRPLYQGTCGSCWGFAAVTALSSRFYIESCGLSGCRNYPQINFGSLNNVNFNLNNVYKFRKLFLTDAFKILDTDKNDIISKQEWTTAIMEYYSTLNSQGSPYVEKHYIAQVLVYILNFQSLGSIDLANKNTVLDRANEAFDIWRNILELKEENDKEENRFASTTAPTTAPTKSGISISKLQNLWNKEPIALSAEKIIACCNDCMTLDFTKPSQPSPLSPLSQTDKPSEPLVCLGSTLDEAWTLLKESGTPTALCIGYNLDSWQPGDHAPTCREVQGPNYSFCSGYALSQSNFNIGDRGKNKGEQWSNDINEIIDKFENSGINPIAIPQINQNLPWTDPQLFRFRAKNVYRIKNNVKDIQREILERGPVTTGFIMYPDFQYSFGTDGSGGQLYKEGSNPVGSDKNSLIYKWSGEGTPIGGHAITIVGWGTFKYTEKITTAAATAAPNSTSAATNSTNSTTEVDYYIPYWICLNSWGTKWGTSGISSYDNRTAVPKRLNGGGYFWILRGTNECQIENNVIAGQPDIANISYPDVVQRYGWGLPPPEPGNAEFIKQRTETILLGPDNYLKFQQANVGGGSYTERKKSISTGQPNSTVYNWSVASMTPPSPFTLFWNNERPIYCIGKLTEDVSELSLDSTLSVSQDTIDALTKIIKTQSNPLLVIGSEQLQFLNIDNTKIKVYRAVNNSSISKHLSGNAIKVVPYEDLSINILDSIAKKCTDLVTDVE